MDYSGNYNIRSNSISLYKGSNLLMDSSSLDTVVIQPTFTPISSLSSPNVLNDLLAKNISLQSIDWSSSAYFIQIIASFEQPVKHIILDRIHVRHGSIHGVSQQDSLWLFYVCPYHQGLIQVWSDEGAFLDDSGHFSRASELLELNVEGMGSRYLSPYDFLSASLYTRSGGEVTNGNTEASDLQNAYANYHETQAQTVPFVWGLKANEIRYGYNDAGQLLLPGEVGFLPVPFSETVWTPNELNYLATSLDNYYTTVARSSFFRTIPITDFNDGAFSGTSPYGGYDRAVELTSMFESFGGENFPEEHRGIVNVFAGMDDYYTSQRLRQFAMMGIPSSIRQAAKVTYDRLGKAADVSRVPKALVDSDLDSLKNDSIAGTTLDTEPKYDTFVRDYLFPIPSDSASSDTDSWNQSYTLFPGVEGVPRRPTRLRDAIIQESTEGTNISFAERLKKYNEDHTSSADKLGQNDMTTLVAIGNESFGDRQQLFLYILRADALAYSSGRKLSEHSPLSTARAVALVWRDAYGELPDRLIYWQYLP